MLKPLSLIACTCCLCVAGCGNSETAPFDAAPDTATRAADDGGPDAANGIDGAANLDAGPETGPLMADGGADVANSIDGPASSEGGADAADSATSPHDGGPCTGALDSGVSIISCPSTYPTSLSAACGAVITPSLHVTFGQCGGAPAFFWASGTYAYLCVYDGVDGGALAGAEYTSDIAEFCDHSSHTIVVGRVLASCDQMLAGQGSDGGLRRCSGVDGGPLPDGSGD